MGMKKETHKTKKIGLFADGLQDVNAENCPKMICTEVGECGKISHRSKKIKQIKNEAIINSRKKKIVQERKCNH